MSSTCSKLEIWARDDFAIPCKLKGYCAHIIQLAICILVIIFVPIKTQFVWRIHSCFPNDIIKIVTAVVEVSDAFAEFKWHQTQRRCQKSPRDSLTPLNKRIVCVQRRVSRSPLQGFIGLRFYCLSFSEHFLRSKRCNSDKSSALMHGLGASIKFARKGKAIVRLIALCRGKNAH
jgi:hypothetical protein